MAIAYDDGGRRTSLTLPNGIVTEYGYDDASQLTSLTYKHGGNTIGDLTYEYDAIGRRIRIAGSFARSITPQTLASATYNAANQQLSFGGQTLSYDLNGNLTSDAWDSRNRLTAVSGPSLNAAFVYDAIGRRTSKTINGAATTFLYDGAALFRNCPRRLAMQIFSMAVLMRRSCGVTQPGLGVLCMSVSEVPYH